MLSHQQFSTKNTIHPIIGSKSEAKIEMKRNKQVNGFVHSRAHRSHIAIGRSSSLLYLCYCTTITTVMLLMSSRFQNDNNIDFTHEIWTDQQEAFDDINDGDDGAIRPVTLLKTSLNEVHNGSDFALGDMDLSGHLQCGVKKCFIPSISDQKVGYLVDKDPYDEARMSQLSQVNEVATWIDREFREGMHFHLGESLTVHLNKTVVRDIYKSTISIKKKKKKETKNHGSRTVAVQKMKKAPDGALFFGCLHGNFRTFESLKVPFLQMVNETGNIKEFKENIIMGHRIMGQVLKAKPDLVIDFQAMVDLNGNLYFIDLDGHIQGRDTDYIERFCPDGSAQRCRKKCLRRFKHHIIDDPILAVHKK